MISLASLDRLRRIDGLIDRAHGQLVGGILELLNQASADLPPEIATLAGFILRELTCDGVEGFAGLKARDCGEGEGVFGAQNVPDRDGRGGFEFAVAVAGGSVVGGGFFRFGFCGGFAFGRHACGGVGVEEGGGELQLFYCTDTPVTLSVALHQFHPLHNPHLVFHRYLTSRPTRRTSKAILDMYLLVFTYRPIAPI